MLGILVAQSQKAEAVSLAGAVSILAIHQCAKHIATILALCLFIVTLLDSDLYLTPS